jgi:glucosamine--fructose-6-phosphate aminotransferase (isomerizing)
VATYAPAALVRQVAALGADLRQLTGPLNVQVVEAVTRKEWQSVRQVYLTGSGDSHHAGRAVGATLRRWARLDCFALSPQPFLEDDPLEGRPQRQDGRDLVIGASASGTTERVVEALSRARARGALTVAVTSAPGSPVTRAAEVAVVAELPGCEPSPGMRTYQATLLTLLLVTVRAAEIRGPDGTRRAEERRQELAMLADAVERTAVGSREPCRTLAESLADAPVVAVLGSGPNAGTAMFLAAKIIEASGMPALAQDLEEWWHVERFARPHDLPVVVIAAPGRSHARAAALVEGARALGRRVVTIAHDDDDELARHAWSVVPVHGTPSEELSPLLYPAIGGHLASELARVLGRKPFQAAPEQLTKTHR